MVANKKGFYISAKRDNSSVRIHLPNRVFSPLAEYFRWGAFRAGNISFGDWSKITGYASAWPEDTSQFEQIAISLVAQSRRLLRRCFSVSNLQALELFITSRLPSCFDNLQCLKINFEWTEGENEWGVPVPLLPLQHPVIKLMHQRTNGLDIEAPTVFVCKNVEIILKNLSKESIKREAELGGCLIGQIPDLDSIVVTDAVCALTNAASPGQFSFTPRFWCDVAHLANNGTRILGWFHSHLCDLGYPKGLSHCDLEIFHKHFTAPWSVAALICASSQQFEIKWFGWQQGCVVQVETQPAVTAEALTEGKVSCQR